MRLALARNNSDPGIRLDGIVRKRIGNPDKIAGAELTALSDSAVLYEFDRQLDELSAVVQSTEAVETACGVKAFDFRFFNAASPLFHKDAAYVHRRTAVLVHYQKLRLNGSACVSVNEIGKRHFKILPCMQRNIVYGNRHAYVGIICSELLKHFRVMSDGVSGGKTYPRPILRRLSRGDEHKISGSSSDRIVFDVLRLQLRLLAAYVAAERIHTAFAVHAFDFVLGRQRARGNVIY